MVSAAVAPAAVWLSAWGTLLAGCYQTAADDDGAPAASSIPTAAYSAVGADYPPPGGGTGSTGVAACDAYLRKIQSCKGIPVSAQTALRDAAKAMREAIASATSPEQKQALEEQCEQAAEALDMCDTHL